MRVEEGMLGEERVMLYADVDHDMRQPFFGEWLRKVANPNDHLFVEGGVPPEGCDELGIPGDTDFSVSSTENTSLHAAAGLIMHRTALVAARLPDELAACVRRETWTASPNTEAAQSIISRFPMAGHENPESQSLVERNVQVLWNLERATWKIVVERRNEVLFTKIMDALAAGSGKVYVVLGRGHYYDRQGMRTNLLMHLRQNDVPYTVIRPRQRSTNRKPYGGEIDEYNRDEMKRAWKQDAEFLKLASLTLLPDTTP